MTTARLIWGEFDSLVEHVKPSVYLSSLSLSPLSQEVPIHTAGLFSFTNCSRMPRKERLPGETALCPPG